MKFLKKYYVYILSLIIPIALFLIISALNNIFPLGENYINILDGNLQHTGFLNYYREVLLNNESLFFSFKGGLGYNFYAVFIYYLCSPLNLLSLFFDNSHLYLFYTIITFLKIGLCGLSCSILLNYFNKNNKWFIIILSCCYALCSYNLMYYLNYMWIDSVIMLPLVILGVEKLVNEKKKLLYFISLSLSIMFNFYIGYMICIFSLIYFIYKFLTTKKLKKEKKKLIINFSVSSILSALTCAVILLPVIYELLNGKADGFTQSIQTDYFKFSMDFFNSFYKITPASFQKIDISYGTPNIYISIFVICLTVLFFFNTKIKRKEKIVVASILGFYLLCFSFNLFDYAWHMFQRPIWYPNRYSFTLSLFLIIIAYKSIINIKYFKINKWFIVSILALIILILESSLYNKVFDDKERIFFVGFSILLIIDYVFMLFLYSKNKGNNNLLLVSLLILFIIIELGLNGYYIIKKTPHNTSIKYHTIQINSFNNEMKLINKKENNKFYRFEFNDNPTYNNGSLFSYNGINFFSSIRNNKTMNFLKNILKEKVSDGCSISYSSYNPFNNSFLGIKYFDGNDNEMYYKKISKKNRYIYENNLINPFMYLVSNNILNTKLYNDDVINNYEKIYQDTVNDNTSLIDENFTRKDDYLTFKNGYIYNDATYANLYYYKNITEDGWLMFYDKNEFMYHNPDIYINNKEMLGSTSLKSSLFLKKGDKLKIHYDISSKKIKANNVRVYFLNYNSLKRYVDINNRNKGNVIKYNKDNYIKVSVNASKNNTLMTTIPYSDGWNIYVDGKKVKKNIIYDTFIGINIKKGNHTIEFKYVPKGFIIGLIISIVSLFTFILFLKKVKIN